MYRTSVLSSRGFPALMALLISMWWVVMVALGEPVVPWIETKNFIG